MTDSANGPGIRIPPPFFYLTGFLFAWAINRFYPIPMFDRTLSVVLAMISLLPSAILGLWSLFEFWHENTTLRPDKPSSFLVVIGPYRITRNPMYLSLTLLYIGLGLLLSLPWAFIFLPVIIFIMNSYVIRREELYLETRFGEQYRVYENQVRRWL